MKLKLRVVPTVEKQVKRAEIEEDNRELLSVKKTVLADLLNEAESFQSRCEDITSPIDTFKIRAELEDFKPKFYYGSSVFSDYAFSQFCTKIGVPTTYIKNCVKEGFDLLAEENLTHWAEKFKSPLVFRQYQDFTGKQITRGVLSLRFSEYDLDEILNDVAETVPNFDERYRIKGWFFNPERFHMRWVDREKLPVPGEDLYMGMSLDSSDVGRSNLRLSFMIYKQVCTNGLIVPKQIIQGYSRKHIGISEEDFREALKYNLTQMENSAVILTDAITNAQEDFLSKDLLDKEKLTKYLSRHQITEKASEKIYDLLEREEYEPTKWGLINSITQVAQDYTLEQRLQMEQTAGVLMYAA